MRETIRKFGKQKRRPEGVGISRKKQGARIARGNEDRTLLEPSADSPEEFERIVRRSTIDVPHKLLPAVSGGETGGPPVGIYDIDPDSPSPQTSRQPEAAVPRRCQDQDWD
jgi:hypothetical protein